MLLFLTPHVACRCGHLYDFFICGKGMGLSDTEDRLFITISHAVSKIHNHPKSVVGRTGLLTMKLL